MPKYNKLQDIPKNIKMVWFVDKEKNYKEFPRERGYGLSVGVWFPNWKHKIFGCPDDYFPCYSFREEAVSAWEEELLKEEISRNQHKSIINGEEIYKSYGKNIEFTQGSIIILDDGEIGVVASDWEDMTYQVYNMQQNIMLDINFYGLKRYKEIFYDKVQDLIKDNKPEIILQDKVVDNGELIYKQEGYFPYKEQDIIIFDNNQIGLILEDLKDLTWNVYNLQNNVIVKLDYDELRDYESKFYSIVWDKADLVYQS
jgi:hypothetical protein